MAVCRVSDTAEVSSSFNEDEFPSFPVKSGGVIALRRVSCTTLVDWFLVLALLEKLVDVGPDVNDAICDN